MGLRGRYEVAAPFAEPYVSEEVVGNEVLLSLLRRVLGSAMAVDSMTWVTSASDSEEEDWRRLLRVPAQETSSAAGKSSASRTGTAALTVFVPLVDLTELSSPLRLLQKSHLACDAGSRGEVLPHEKGVVECAHADKVYQTYPLRAGSTVIFDSQLLHTSDPNVSPTDRPALQTTYVAASLTGIGEKYERHTRAFDGLSGPLRRLLSKWDTREYTELLESKLAATGADLATLQSTYFYSASDEGREAGTKDESADSYDYDLVSATREEL